MNRLMMVAIMAGSLVGLEMRVDAARGCRPTRRQCAGVTHQPCARAALRAARCDEAVIQPGGSCSCAFFVAGVHLYYGVFWHDSCDNTNATWGLMPEGDYDTSNYDPCPTCPSAQCILVNPVGSTDGKYQRKFKQDRLWTWDEKFVLKNGSKSFKKKDGTEWVATFEATEIVDGRMLISFISGNTQYFARLDSFRVDVQETSAASAVKGSVFDANLGREIEQPPADQKVRDVTNQVKIVAPHFAEVKIGTTTYVVTTVSQLQQ
ncbi:MAG: hypothetical protein WCJ09_04870 [Planctomycetota bacterium]